jgi:hypothetical protein
MPLASKGLLSVPYTAFCEHHWRRSDPAATPKIRIAEKGGLTGQKPLA